MKMPEKLIMILPWKKKNDQLILNITTSNPLRSALFLPWLVYQAHLKTIHISGLLKFWIHTSYCGRQ